MKRIPPELRDLLVEAGPGLVEAGITGLEEAAARHARRVWDRACADRVVLRRRLDRQRAKGAELHPARLLARAANGLARVRTKAKLRRAEDRCKALETTQ